MGDRISAGGFELVMVLETQMLAFMPIIHADSGQDDTRDIQT